MIFLWFSSDFRMIFLWFSPILSLEAMKKRGVSVGRQEAAEESEALEEEAKSGTEAPTSIHQSMCFVLPFLMKDHY